MGAADPESAGCLPRSPSKRHRKSAAPPADENAPPPAPDAGKALDDAPRPPLVAPVPPPPRIPREMSFQRDRASDFEPLRFLGKGAFGAVVLVQRKNWPDRRYAMKVLLKKKLGGKAAREMALVEREILRTVRHAYLVPLCCSFQSRTRLYLVTPYFPGGDLHARLAREQKLAPGEVRAHVARLALAVAHLHLSGVIHRDIKGANVLLDGGGRAHLADFGLAAYCDDAAKPGRKASFAGTLDYMAPELFLKSSTTYDGAVDYWSLGVLAFECLAGRTPFHAPATRDLFKNILRATPDFGDVPEETRDAVKGLLTKDPAARDGLRAMRLRPYFADALTIWGRVADADDPLGQTSVPHSDAESPSTPRRDFRGYMSFDGEAAPASSEMRPDLFRGFSYRAEDEPLPARRHPLLEDDASAPSSLSSASFTERDRSSARNSTSSEGTGSLASSGSMASSSARPRGHRRVPSDAMKSVLSFTRRSLGGLARRLVPSTPTKAPLPPADASPL